ncbi:MAG: hypothetical protein M3N97_05360 [Pseudomonadota bacterium]|nr:hypothetical protein [Pseudomonadota bacterium]
MATRHIPAKRRKSSTRSKTGSAPKRETREPPAASVYGVPVPDGLHEAIEAERGNLAKADSVLGCLAASMECETDPVTGPYYPDVAEVARELVRQSINRLDSLVLEKLLQRNKVREQPAPCLYWQAARAALPAAAHATVNS